MKLVVCDPDEPTPEEKRREEWDRKHPRCGECGQFLRRRKPRHPDALNFGLREDEWIGHHFQDYWGEWDHV